MAGTKVTLTVQGHPRPSVRITARAKWTKAARNYLEWQKHVAQCCMAIPERPVPWKQIRVTYRFYVWRRRSDLTNLIKAAEDGLQYGQLIANDRAVVEVTARCFSCSDDEERVEIELEEVD